MYEVSQYCLLQVATYDGDTPQEERRGRFGRMCPMTALPNLRVLAIRETASVIFTNFVRPLLKLAWLHALTLN